ncbi:MAG: hypothetical protein AAFY76_03610 [Cyanobacteria bacterium J06649_11]
MKIITDIEDAKALLKAYAGGMSKIAFYSESLSRIAIRLTVPDVDEVIYLIGVGCERINGSFSFPNVALSIEQHFSEEVPEFLTIIRDKRSGFELITTGGFTIAQGLESEFGSAFENLISPSS